MTATSVVRIASPDTNNRTMPAPDTSGLVTDHELGGGAGGGGALWPVTCRKKLQVCKL